jgi:putative oxygen-independent coproporphyrinogen III oxidase
MTADRRGLALYIHWPFCVSKCPYCDFNSHVRQGIDEAAWAKALVADLAYEADKLPGRTLTSIFFGGGTPSLMPPWLVEQLIEAASHYWTLAPDCEITLEANPSSVEAANFADLAKAGVNRVSIGLQSLREEALHFLGRAHSVTEALGAIGIAQSQFARVNVDLIYARPDHRADAWEVELNEALALGTGHLSLYQLTIEPGTRFETLVRDGTLTPLDPDEGADLFELTQAMTSAAGLPAYEVSNHARAGEESRHNLAYWRYNDYAGIGPGAHGRRGGLATMRHKKPENFLSAVTRNGHGAQEEALLTSAEQAREALVMGLRLAEGVDLARVRGIAGGEVVDLDRIAGLERQGLLRLEKDHVAVTPAGMLLLDSVLTEIVVV